MPGANLVDSANLLKDLFDSGPVKDQFHNKINLYKWVKERQMTGRYISARNFIFALESGRPGGLLFAADAAITPAATPSAERSREVQATVRPNWLYMSVEASGQIMRLSQSNEGAFAKEISHQMKRQLQNGTKQLNYMAYGNGSGAVARINDAAIDASVELDAAGPDYRSHTGTVYQKGNRYIHANQTYQAASA